MKNNKKKLGKIAMLLIPMRLLTCCGPRQNASSDVSQENSGNTNVSDVITSESDLYSDLLSENMTSDQENTSGSSTISGTKSQTQTAVSSAGGNSGNNDNSGKFDVDGDTSFQINVS